MKRWPLVVLVAVAAALVFGYVAYWTEAANRLEAGVRGWIEARRSEGYVIDEAGLSRTGFPFAVRVVVAEPRIAAPAAPPAWAWGGARTIVEMSPFRFDRVTVATDGTQSLTLIAADEKRTYTGTVEVAGADIFEGGWLPVITATVRGLSLADAASGDRLALTRGELRTMGDPAGPADGNGETYRVVFDAGGLVFPNTWQPPLGAAVDRLALEASLKGMLAPEPWPTALARWRDEGGTVEVTRLEGTYGPLEISGDGTFALDPGGQPIGSMSARLRGWAPALSALAEERIIDPRTATTVASVLDGFAKPDADGRPSLTVPITLQNRILSAGPMPLIRLPAVHWLDGAAGR